MRLTVKLRDGSKLVTAHVDLEGDCSAEACASALLAAEAALAPEPEKRKTSRLGADTRGRTATRDPLPDIES